MPTATAKVAMCTDTSAFCFPLFLCLAGLDVELDSELRPWLLEVNVCPSLAVCGSIDSIYSFDTEFDSCLSIDLVKACAFLCWLWNLALKASKTDTMSQTLLNNLLVDTLNLVGVDATIGRCAPNNDVFADLVEMYARRGAFRLAYPTGRMEWCALCRSHALFLHAARDSWSLKIGCVVLSFAPWLSCAVRNVDQLSAFYAVSEGDIDVCRAAQQAASRLAAQLGAT